MLCDFMIGQSVIPGVRCESSEHTLEPHGPHICAWHAANRPISLSLIFTRLRDLFFKHTLGSYLVIVLFFLFGNKPLLGQDDLAAKHRGRLEQLDHEWYWCHREDV